ncbi:sodium:proline symporter [bacterium DOLZORAL124_64_63]|nr:MAG: sodium:proline symporter [bacterium DOLZORAL124_64_63]
MSTLDWGIIIGFLVLAMGIGVYHMRQATSGLDEYFVSGRKASWWLLGTSMAATSFAADTPLAVSGFVIKSGISWNWYWWASAMSGLLVVFFFTRFWRRSRITTDVELIEVRYSGKPASFLRGYLAIHSGVLTNCITIGWVNLAMVKVLTNTVGVNEQHALYFCFIFSLVYTMMSGLRGVMATDLVQFFISMFGAIYLAVAAVHGLGGMGGVKEALVAAQGAERAAEITSIFPRSGTDIFLPILTFIFFQWWAASNMGGGSYLVQRMLSARDEKHAYLGTLWYNIAQYCLRSWPWIVAGLCAAALYPGLEDPETGYILLMKKFLPNGMLGLVLASFFAAYMSTIDTHLNWGASYLVNDVYKRFFRREASQRHYIVASMVFTVVLAVLGMLVTTLMQSIRDGWYIITAMSGGVSIIYVLRWYWWRINAWSEIAAMVSAVIGTVVFRFWLSLPYPHVLYLIVPITVAIALVVTFLTAPVDAAVLENFYRRIRPGGRLWDKVAQRLPDVQPDARPSSAVPAYVMSVIAVYGALFGVGKLLLGPWPLGVLLLGVSLGSGYGVWRYVGRVDWQ